MTNTPNKKQAKKTIPATLDQVMVVVGDEHFFQNIMPGAGRSLPEMLNVSQVDIDKVNSTVTFVDHSEQTSVIRFSKDGPKSTSCNVSSGRPNKATDLYIDIIKNYFAGVLISESLNIQRRYRRSRFWLFSLMFLAFFLVVYEYAPNEDNAGIDVVIFASLMSTIFLGGIIVPLLSIVVTPIHRLFYAKQLKETSQNVKRFIRELKKYKWDNLVKKYPFVSKTIRSKGRANNLMRDNTLVHLVDLFEKFITKNIRRATPVPQSEVNSSDRYLYSLLKMEDYTFVQLNRRDVVCSLKLPSDYGHVFIQSARDKPQRRLAPFQLVLEGDFQKYFRYYVASSQQIEALRIATPEVMEAIVEHGRPFNLEVRDDRLYLHTKLKQFHDPIWIARTLTAGHRVAKHLDKRSDQPEAYTPLPGLNTLSLSESFTKQFLLVFVTIFVAANLAWITNPEVAIPDIYYSADIVILVSLFAMTASLATFFIHGMVLPLLYNNVSLSLMGLAENFEA